MIKAEDLRIGDLVRVNCDCEFLKETVCTVSEIRKIKAFKGIMDIASLISVNGNGTNPSEVWCSDIEGIPLTPEILEKNGFVMRDDTVVFLKDRLALKPLRDGKGYQVGLGSLQVLFAIVRIVKYVHELQHILWALGKDANLKI